MISDARNSSRPMVNNINNDATNTNYPVNEPNVISRQFDNIGKDILFKEAELNTSFLSSI